MANLCHCRQHDESGISAFIGKKWMKKRLIDMADSHGRTTLWRHFRNDHSCYYTVSYDTIINQSHFRATY